MPTHMPVPTNPHTPPQVNLKKYNGRIGRVVQQAPEWLMKTADAGEASAGGLVAVLLDSRATDRERGRGVWVAVSRHHLKLQT